MSTWTTPRTWVSGATVTAANMNTLRDNLNFLKGAVDLITNSTTADVGDTTTLRIFRATTSSVAFSTGVTADSPVRFAINADGQQEWGSGAASRDTILYRDGVRRIKLAAPTAGAADLQMSGMLILRTQSGAPTDASFGGTAIAGGICMDTANKRLYLRFSSSWSYITFP